MLPEKPWKFEALARLGLGILLCLFLAGTVMAAMRFAEGGVPQPPWTFWAAAIAAAIFSSVALLPLGKPWKAEHPRRFMLVLFCAYVGMTASVLAQFLAGKPGEMTMSRTLVAAFSLNGAVLALLPRFLREHQVRWSEAFGFSLNRKRALVYGALGALVFLPMGWLLQIVSAQAMKHFGWKIETQAAVQALGRTENWPEKLALALVAIALAPLAEEILFRGILYPAVKLTGRPRGALWGVSVLFAAIHGNLPTFLPLLLLAILLTRLYENTQNLLAPIVAHSLFNAANFVTFFLADAFGKSLPPQP